MNSNDPGPPCVKCGAVMSHVGQITKKGHPQDGQHLYQCPTKGCSMAGQGRTAVVLREKLTVPGSPSSPVGGSANLNREGIFQGNDSFSLHCMTGAMPGEEKDMPLGLCEMSGGWDGDKVTFRGK